MRGFVEYLEGAEKYGGDPTPEGFAESLRDAVDEVRDEIPDLEPIPVFPSVEALAESLVELNDPSRCGNCGAISASEFCRHCRDLEANW